MWYLLLQQIVVLILGMLLLISEVINMIGHGPKKAVSVLLPMKLYEQIKTLSEESQRTTSAYIRQIIRIYLRYYAEHAQEAENDPLIVK